MQDWYVVLLLLVYVTQVLGADIGRAQLHWMHHRLLGPHAASVLADAAGQVAREQLAAYGLVEKIGRGVVRCLHWVVSSGSADAYHCLHWLQGAGIAS